jgi:hypothetical protein
MRGRQHDHHDGDEHRDLDSRDRALLLCEGSAIPCPMASRTVPRRSPGK